MPEVIALRGRSALSSFRIAKLLGSLSAIRPDHAVTALSAHYWHFVEVERPLDEHEYATLTRLLTYGPLDASDAASDAALLVVPRLGTISPWSSKATDIAHNCALGAVRRIERGVAFDVATRDRMYYFGPRCGPSRHRIARPILR